MTVEIDNYNRIIEAFERMYTSNYHKIRSFCLGYLRDESSASNIAQDVFVIVWNNRNSLDFSENLLPYLFVVAKNRCLNELKREKLKKNHSDYINTNKDSLFSASLRALQLEDLYEKDLELKINNELEKMPQKVKATFLLSRFEGKKYEEIALLQNISVKTVEYRIMYALRILRSSLKKYFLVFFLLGFILR